MKVSKFYFDLPISKGAQSSIEHCSLKRTIFKVENEMPYLEKKIRVIDVKTKMFSPIEFSIQNLQKQVALIKEACDRNDAKQLQLLLQGSLLVQVNEGPKKMAEVFLKSGTKESEYTMKLRQTFRDFINVNERAVMVHVDYARSNPVFMELQKQLELGLNRLTANLQPYLK
ncbi:Dedicator of cytokinesis family protein [Histomonas meleagridis]|uniref:Dedicator of cytokinesis family protein n=1 Tax=Histomonas meleagridis TaxID=135588 RepID=UPI0035597A80|nr:Dedicator of cytokinesis family protein [Histomonas meleagridis]KAH0803649.1 Dedicator of cytokinesis family protein [Histomonas meleagridis]